MALGLARSCFDDASEGKRHNRIFSGERDLSRRVISCLFSFQRGSFWLFYVSLDPFLKFFFQKPLDFFLSIRFILTLAFPILSLKKQYQSFLQILEETTKGQMHMKILKFLLVLQIAFAGSMLFAQAPAADSQAAKDQVDELLKGELVPENDDAELTEEQKKRKQFVMEHEALWKNPDYKGYNKAFQELHQLSKTFANNQFRLALSNYQSGMNTIMKNRDYIEQFRKEEAEKKRLDEKYYWQRVDRKAREERLILREKNKAKQDALNYFSKAINHMDEIKNPDLRERPEFKRLMSDIYRQWSLVEYDLQNLPQVIPILELYIEIDDNEKEYPAHKYLASAYAFEEKMIKNTKGPDDLLFKFRYKKNVHLLRATELKYGKDSPEYKHIVNLVNRDEVISVAP